MGSWAIMDDLCERKCRAEREAFEAARSRLGEAFDRLRRLTDEGAPAQSAVDDLRAAEAQVAAARGALEACLARCRAQFGASAS
jgi:hypothetical protein